MERNETAKEIVKKIEDFGKEIADQIKKEESPKFKLPIRTKTNVSFNERTSLLELGDKMSTRRFLNVAHTRKFMQSMLISSACRNYIQADRSVGKRELYYNLKHSLPDSKDNTFEDDTESGGVLDDLEASLDILREQLHVNAKQKGTVYGDIVLKQAGDEINCMKMGRGGWAIPGYVEDIEVLSFNADFILAVENDAMMNRLIEEKFAKKMNCILVTGEGMFPRGVRRFIKRMQEIMKLPVIAFVDGDPYGFYIYSVLKYGSIQLAHLSDRYAVPDSKYVGMTMEDIDSYNLENVTERLKDVDKKRLGELMGYDWFKQSKEWMAQVKSMQKKGVRIEQQALANKSIDFVAKEYLPEKIEQKLFLP